MIGQQFQRKYDGHEETILKKVQETFIRSMSKNQSINSDLEDAFSLSSEIERETLFLNRLVTEDINLKSE